jgi:hypothetical protein
MPIVSSQVRSLARTWLTAPTFGSSDIGRSGWRPSEGPLVGGPSAGFTNDHFGWHEEPPTERLRSNEHSDANARARLGRDLGSGALLPAPRDIRHFKRVTTVALLENGPISTALNDRRRDDVRDETGRRIACQTGRRRGYWLNIWRAGGPKEPSGSSAAQDEYKNEDDSAHEGDPDLQAGRHAPLGY